MTEIINDTIKDVTMTIDGDDWLVSEAIVELSEASTPNYVDINKMIPDSEAGTSVPSPPDLLIDKDYELRVDNELISQRDTDADEDTLLFKGKLANISATGEKTYEGIAYDPSQEGFNASQGSGSMMNQTIQVAYPFIGANLQFSLFAGMNFEPRTRLCSFIIDKVIDEMGLENADNQLTFGGVTRTGPGGSVTGAIDQQITFPKNEMKVKRILDLVAESTDSTYWFDKEGVFHFGVPDPTKHILHLITEASDGMTTGPYQSVKVIGSDVVSEDGWNRESSIPEERIVKKYVVARNSNTSALQAIPLEESEASEMPEPVFEYRNAQITTEAQADNVASKVAKDLAKQQADGKITVVGFPEVVPLDAIQMPQASDDSKDNYYPNQPMGGYSYGVYKVKHKLNGSNGFITEITPAGLVGAARVQFTPEEDSPEGQEEGDGSSGELTATELRRDYGMSPPGGL